MQMRMPISLYISRNIFRKRARRCDMKRSWADRAIIHIYNLRLMAEFRGSLISSQISRIYECLVHHIYGYIILISGARSVQSHVY